MLMLSTFLRVRIISVLVPRHAAAGRRACRRRTLRAALAPPPATLARAPEPPEPADAHPAPPRRRLAPPPPGTASTAAAASPLRRRRRGLFRCPEPRARGPCPGRGCAGYCGGYRAGRRRPPSPRALASPAPRAARHGMSAWPGRPPCFCFTGRWGPRVRG